MPEIILASQSPRRKELLTQMGVTFETIPSDIPEPLDEAHDPRDNAKSLALAKALHVALVHLASGLQLVDVDVADVYFKTESQDVEEERETYLALNTWHDKAGAYGIQTGAAPLIERIDGDMTTIIGLPTHILADMLTQVDMDAHGG